MTDAFVSQFAHLKGATIQRVKMEEGKTLVLLFDNGAKLEATIDLEFTGGGYDFHDAYLDVKVEPAPAEQDGWIEL